MNEVSTAIYVVESGDYEQFWQKRFNVAQFSQDQIVVNDTGKGYAIAFRDEVFMELNLGDLIARVARLFGDNLPNTVVNYTVDYYFNECSLEVADKVFDLHNLFVDVNDSHRFPMISLSTTDHLEELFNEVQKYQEQQSEPANDPFEQLRGLTTGFNPNDSVGYVGDGYASNYGSDDYDDYGGYGEDEDDEPTDTNWRVMSHVLDSLEDPKRQYRRHGILIAERKEDIKADRKLIKKFLREFIPGDENWKKDFRNELASRFISAFVVTKKQAKKLEREHRRKQFEHNTGLTTERVLNLAQRIFTPTVAESKPANSGWFDPRK